jgi:citrate synthase
LTECGRGVTGEEPNIDFALVALAQAYRLPLASPLALFALGHSVGWLAHAMEQAQSGTLIRPRARYVGPPIAGLTLR